MQSVYKKYFDSHIRRIGVVLLYKHHSLAMKTRCKHCLRQCTYKEVANAHTVFKKESSEVIFESTDDTLGIEVCQVCSKPTFWAKLTQPKSRKLTSPDITTMSPMLMTS